MFFFISYLFIYFFFLGGGGGGGGGCLIDNMWMLLPDPTKPSPELMLTKILDTTTWLPWWRHQMETFSALLAICAGNSPVPVNSPHKGQWRGALVFSLICARIDCWVNTGEAGDLRHHPAHYDIIVMSLGLHNLKSKLPCDAFSMPNHFLNQCWLNVNWILMDKHKKGRKSKISVIIQMFI